MNWNRPPAVDESALALGLRLDSTWAVARRYLNAAPVMRAACRIAPVTFGKVGPGADDWALVEFLARRVGVTAVPGSSFYATRGGGGKTQIRVNFAKTEATLQEAARRLTGRSLKAPRK